MNTKLACLATAAVVAIAAYSLAADHETPSVSADAALEKLRAGNARYAEAKTSAPKPVAEARKANAESQHPFAIVVGCADSRVAPEIVFDENIGALFVVRTAGNLVDDYALGSIEYAVEHLGTRLIVVLGHERCGAVQAAVGAADAPGHVGNIVRDIQPAVQAAKKKNGDVLVDAIKENVTRVAAKIDGDKAVMGEHGPTEVKVVKGYYDLDTGKVEWLP
jgi:carbonic anhydrase